ncbi:MAG: TonB-dependent receptor, partial [Dysgonamonadaceae bacterium]|nr:TonB-dependent receptor [Dysgonamonadaceae bacterium]
SIGLNIGGVPKYQDVTAKANIPLKHGNLSIIGLIGLSKINIKTEMSAEEGWINGDLSEDIHMRNQQYFTGVNYMVRFNANTRLENRFSYQYFNSNIDMDRISFPTLNAEPYLKSSIAEGRISYISTVYHRFNSKNFLQGGLGIDIYQTHFDETYYADTTVPDPIKLRNTDRNTALLKGYLQWQYRFTDALKLVSGVYSQFYLFNHNIWAEPRLGLKWTVSKRSSINVGLGLHSQLQPRQVYFYEKNGTLPNKNLTFSKSGQAVLGYDLKIMPNLRFKTEIYYQYLFDIPVIEDIPQESILNMGDDYYNSWDIIFVNKGTGENYGIEITIEKFFHKGYYFLVTGSLYNATYCGYDKVKRNAKFSGNYSLNVIGGYEWKLWKTLLLSINVKSIVLGNKRILPVTASQRGTSQIFDYSHAYEKQYPLYFRTDLNIAVKLNVKKVAMELFFEMENITNRKNIQGQVYNQSRATYEYAYQTGFMPMGGFKIYF